MSAEPAPSGLRGFLSFGVGLAGGLGGGISGLAATGRRPPRRRARPRPTSVPLWLQYVLATVVWACIAAVTVAGAVVTHNILGAVVGFVVALFGYMMILCLVVLPAYALVRASARAVSRRRPSDQGRRR